MQTSTLQFLAFFIYDKNGNPTWYTAQLNDDGTGNYIGALYATTGTHFAQAWNPAQLTINQAGMVKFAPINKFQATLTYTVNGVGTVVKTIQRQTLTSEALSGNYSGSLSGSISGCANPPTTYPRSTTGSPSRLPQADNSAATFIFTVVAANEKPVNAVCTLTGAMRAHLFDA